MKKILFFLLCIWIVLPLGAQSVFINSAKSENPDELWYKGSSELLSVYLQAEGLSIVSRNKLSDLFQEIEINEAGLTGGKIEKGQWLGAEYIVIGSLKNNAGAYSLNVSVTKSSSGNVLKAWNLKVNNKETIAESVKKISSEIKTEIQQDAKKEIKNLKSQKDSSPFAQNPVTLLKFFEAIELMQSGKEAEGMVELVQLTINAPKFEYPYIWMAGFFEKYGYTKISSELKKHITNETLRSINQLSSKAVLLYGSQIKKEVIDGVKDLFQKNNFSFIDPQTITILDTEKQLQKWSYSKKFLDLSRLIDYQSSLHISISKKPRSYMVKITNSKDGKSIFEKEFIDINNLNTHLASFLNSYTKGKLDKSVERGIEEDNDNWASYDGKDEKTQLFYLLSKQIMPVTVLYRLIEEYRFKASHFKEHFWKEIFARVKEKDREIYLISYYLLKDSLSSRTSGSYDEKDAALFIKNIDKLKSSRPLIKFCQAFNKAYYALHKKEFKKSLKLFEEAILLLNTADIERNFSMRYIEPSLYYWSWYCSYSIGVKDSENKYLKKVKMYMKRYPLPTLTVLISPYLRVSYSKLPFRAIIRNKMDFELNEQLSPKAAVDWEYDLSVKIEIPKMPIRAVPGTLNDAKQAVTLFMPWFKKNHTEVVKVGHDHRIDNFIKAVSHLVSHPDYTVSKELKSSILELSKKMRHSDTVRVHCIFEEYELAKKFILENKDISANSRKYTLKTIAHKTLSFEQYMDHLILAQQETKDESIVRFWDLIYCFDHLNTEKAKKYLNVLLKKKNLSERNIASIKFCEAEILRLEGNPLQALELFKDIQEKYWDKNFHFELGGNLNVKVQRKISYLSMEERKEFKPSKWFLVKRGGTHDHFHNGRKREALTFLNKEVYEDFIKIYRKIYYDETLIKDKIDIEIQNLVNKHGNKIVPQIINVLNAFPTFREEYIAERILDLLSTPENADAILDAFEGNFWFFSFALKANKAKSLKILEENLWILGGEGFITPMLVDAVLENKLKSCYPVIFSFFLESRSNFTSHLKDIRKQLHTELDEETQRSLKFILNQALAVCKTRINEKYYEKYIFEVSEILFTAGILDGLVSMIELTQLEDKHPARAMSRDVLNIYNKKVLGIKASSLKEAASQIRQLSWSRVKEKWQYNKERVNQSIKTPEVKFENNSILDLNLFNLKISEPKEKEFKVHNKKITWDKFEGRTLAFAFVDTSFTWWYMDSSGSENWSIEYLKNATKLEDFTPQKHHSLDFKRRNPKINKNIYGVKADQIIILKNDLAPDLLYLIDFDYFEDKITAKYKIIELSKK